MSLLEPIGLLFCVLLVCLLCYFFFFSSRRRHTRCLSDWSSDVCSSDLICAHFELVELADLHGAEELADHQPPCTSEPYASGRRSRKNCHVSRTCRIMRSEERRVGKECRCRWSA